MHLSIQFTLTKTSSTSSIHLHAYSCVAIKTYRKNTWIKVPAVHGGLPVQSQHTPQSGNFQNQQLPAATSAPPPSVQHFVLLLGSLCGKQTGRGFIPSWKAPVNLPSAHFLRDCEILVFLGQICVASSTSYFKHKNSKEKQRMSQCIQDEIKAQQTLPEFH